MEIYSKTTRFALACNASDKIIGKISCIYLSLVMRKSAYGFHIRLESRWPAQVQRLTGELKFWIYNEKILFCVSQNEQRY